MNRTDDAIASPGERLEIDDLYISQMRLSALPAVPMKTCRVYIAILVVVCSSSGIDSREHHEGEPLQMVESCSRVRRRLYSRSHGVVQSYVSWLSNPITVLGKPTSRTNGPASLPWGGSDRRNFGLTPSRDSKHHPRSVVSPRQRHSIRDNVVCITPHRCPGGNS